MIDWVSVSTAIPDDRRLVLVWVVRHGAFPHGGSFGMSKYNRKRNGRGDFDIEGFDWFGSLMVTHWADIDPPQQITNPPPVKP